MYHDAYSHSGSSAQACPAVIVHCIQRKLLKTQFLNCCPLKIRKRHPTKTGKRPAFHKQTLDLRQHLEPVLQALSTAWQIVKRKRVCVEMPGAFRQLSITPISPNIFKPPQAAYCSLLIGFTGSPSFVSLKYTFVPSTL